MAATNKPPPSKRRRLAAPSSTAKVELIDINDDCLIEIFRELSLPDLNAVGLTCHRLHGIVVNDVYKYQTSLQQLDIGAMARRYRNIHNTNDFKYSIERIGGCLQRFGHVIQHIDLVNKYSMSRKSTKEIFNVIVGNCLSTLTSLNMHRVHLVSKTILRGQRLFTNLEKLEVNNQPNYDELLAMCHKLKELRINFNLSDAALSLQYSFPMLKTFKLERSDDMRRSRKEDIVKANEVSLVISLGAFIQNHLGLTSLTLAFPPNFDFAVVGQLVGLEELTLDFCRLRKLELLTNMHQLNGLTKLRKIEYKNLTQQSDHVALSRLLKQSASADSLEYLRIEEDMPSETLLDGLSHVHNLRQLAYHTVFISEAGYYELIPDAICLRLQQWTNLVELELSHLLGRFGKLFLQNLTGAHNSLQKLSINIFGAAFDNDWIEILAQFECLIYLKIGMRLPNRINWQQMQRLTKLKQLHLCGSASARITTGECIRNLFTNLEAVDKLERLDISHIICNDHFIMSIGHFVNLKELKLFRVQKFSASDWTVLGKLKQLHRLEAVVFAPKDNPLSVYTLFPNDSFVDLVRNLKQVEYFHLKIDGIGKKRDTIVSLKELRLQTKLESILKTRDNFSRVFVCVRSDLIKIQERSRIN